MSGIALDTPLAQSLSESVQSRIIEQGWTQEDDTSLAEYIMLMLANGKTQEQIASELAGELLQDASGTEEFAQWLFEQVAVLTGEAPADDTNTTDSTVQTTNSDQQVAQPDASIPAAYDMDMGDAAPDNAPRGPKGLHGGRSTGRQGSRGSGAGNRSADSVLHRTRGTDRINGHVRGAPKGPRGGISRDVRPGMQKALNGLNMGQSAPNPLMQNGQQSPMGMSPQQQMEFMAMMEQQARMMAQFMPGMVQGMNGNGNANGNANGNGNFAPNGQQNGQSRSLFDRVDTGRGRGGRGRGRGGIAQNGTIRKESEDKNGEESQQGDASSQMDVASQSQGQAGGNDPSSTVCYFNLRCTNQACPYVHQSSVAPEGTVIDMTTDCTFGSACKNPKCVGKHPSPATKKAHQAEQMCKFFPNCQNPACTFKHPSMPLCGFGSSCTNKDCRFTHLTTKCRFNPCLNPRCAFQHEEGQNKTFADYSWTPETAAAKTTESTSSNKDHVSDRKFVDENAEEELIKPESDVDVNGQVQQQQQQANPPTSEVLT